ncbi:MAG: 4'-phosphopantetheinyl transferase superfamily protein [Gemmatimonadaceae bacterium]
MHIRSSDVGERLGTVDVAGAVADLWFAWVGDHAGDVERFSRDHLSDNERARLGTYRSRDAAERYVVTRSLVRIVLGDRLGIPAREIGVSRTDTGKPVVAEGVHFNVSHSGDLVLLALSDTRAIGVDVERRRDVARVESLTQRWLTDDERRDLQRLRATGVTESEAFLRVWSLKEARLKALGVGIAGAFAARVHSVDALPLDSLLDSLLGQHYDQGYVGAVAFA